MKLTREQWLTEISDLMLAEIFQPVTEIRPDMRLKLSVGFPPGKKSAIGFALSASASAEGFNEIFISPVKADSIVVLAILAHEIIHAIDDCKSGHNGQFKRIARAIGFTGRSLTAIDTNDLRNELSPSLYSQLQEYVSLFGDIPHAEVNYSAMKQQRNRNLKVWCDCGFKFNTSKTQIENCLAVAGYILCPACAESMNYDI